MPYTFETLDNPPLITTMIPSPSTRNYPTFLLPCKGLFNNTLRLLELSLEEVQSLLTVHYLLVNQDPSAIELHTALLRGIPEWKQAKEPYLLFNNLLKSIQKLLLARTLTDFRPVYQEDTSLGLLLLTHSIHNIDQFTLLLFILRHEPILQHTIFAHFLKTLFFWITGPHFSTVVKMLTMEQQQTLLALLRHPNLFEKNKAEYQSWLTTLKILCRVLPLFDTSQQLEFIEFCHDTLPSWITKIELLTVLLSHLPLLEIEVRERTLTILKEKLLTLLKDSKSFRQLATILKPRELINMIASVERKKMAVWIQELLPPIAEQKQAEEDEEVTYYCTAQKPPTLTFEMVNTLRQLTQEGAAAISIPSTSQPSPGFACCLLDQHVKRETPTSIDTNLFTSTVPV